MTDAHCGLANGAISTTVSGGLPPYTFSWSNGATTSGITGLPPGTYTVTVTDGLSNTAESTADVVNVMTLNTVTATELRGDCAGSCSGICDIYEGGLGGTAPYSYSYMYVQHPTSTVARFEGMCYGSNLYTVTDANGCSGTVDAYIGSSFGWSTFPPLAVTPACGTDANGAIIMPSVGSYAAFHVTGANYDQIHEFFQEGPYTIGGLAAGQYYVALYDPWEGMVVYCTMPVDVTVGALAEPCGGISGTVFHDADQDCAFNGADLKLPYKVLSIEPGGAYAITDGQGSYAQHLDLGAYTMEQSLINEVALCPGDGPIPFTLDTGTPNVVIDMADSSTVPADVRVWMVANSARPGFRTSAWISVSNWTSYPSGDVTLDLAFDPLLQNASASSWDLGVLAPHSQVTLSFEADVPADISLLGTVIHYEASLSNTGPDADAVNNSYGVDVTITGSYDPNDKQGVTSSRTSAFQYFIDQDYWVDYTIRFQNTGSAAAETVVLRDTLDVDLDPRSLEILGASHTFAPSFGQGRELIFTFDEINLPDSLSDPLGSQGYISFRVRPVEDVAVGDVLSNTAGIYFDFNPPIITNTVEHIVEISTGMAHGTGTMPAIWPNPVHDMLNVALPEGTRGLTLHAADGRAFPIRLRSQGRSVQLDLTGAAPGVYFLRTANGVLRFVKD